MYLEPTLSVKGYRVKGLVTVETFVVQRSQSSAASMGYTTLENTLNKKKAMCTCSARRGGRDWGGGVGGVGDSAHERAADARRKF